jgi:hypothetical protein
MLLINSRVPEDDAHIVSFWLSECKNQSLTEVTPHILRLNVGKNNIGINRHANSQAKAFPRH